MLEKFIFENHLGQRFEGLPNGVYLNYNDLRNYSWSYDTINNRISRFYMGTKNRKLPLVIKCNSDEEAVAVKNRLHELAEADIEAKIPGKIFVGDYYTNGYITASTKSNYLITKRLCYIDLTLTSDDPAWYREQTHPFHIIGGGDDPDPITPKSAEGTSIVINDGADGAVLNGLTLYGKTTQNGTPTPENPVALETAGASGAINTTVAGKNLATAQMVYKGANNYAEVTEDGRNCIKFQSDKSIKNTPITFKENTQYRVSFDVKTVPRQDGTMGENAFCFYYTDGTSSMLNTEHEQAWKRMAIVSKAGKTVKEIGLYGFNYLSYVYVDIDTFQIEEGTSATEYEPYKGQTLTASTPNGLPGMIVTDGSSNHTDENGQTWTCDKIDFAKGEYEKWFATDILTGDEEWAEYENRPGVFHAVATGIAYGGMCSHYPVGFSYVDGAMNLNYTVRNIICDSRFTGNVDGLKAFLSGEYAAGTPVTVLRRLHVDGGGGKKIALSAEELAQYAALHTNKPITTVFNDSGAYMVLGYYPAVENKNVEPDSNVDSFIFGGGADHPYDYPYDYALSVKGKKIVCDSVGGNAFRLLIYGEAVNPSVVISGHVYTINGTIGKGETLLVDSLEKKITLTTAFGNKINWFDKRGREDYIFEPIPAGQNTVSWLGTFGFDLTVIEKRSEPRWT